MNAALHELGAILAFAAIGVAIGLFHFATLSWNLRLYLAGAPWRGIALQGARLALVIAALAAVAHAGAVPLLVALAGVVAGRQWALRNRRPA
ncbi:hypothetical protein GCM10023144_33130 [Pigmentiphaga soli]|uniref:ATP synthase subunit I n=1 Tax=Pigmentiphaga soli TaxID=1007095 RepID=A0ABP8HCZ3_9BURK